MPCVSPDGSLTPVAAQVLAALAAVGEPGAVDAVARAAALPAYRVRSTLRELQSAGLIDETDGRHLLTAEGSARLAAAPAAASPAPASAALHAPVAGPDHR